ncbi:MAG TPA: cation:proton antiporter [Mycobacteriales bacterium]|nr:cation:proton antiporter [Mycobacteriales bacterium]
MDLADLVFAVVGVGALLASLLPRVLEGRPFSLPIVFVALGLLLGALPLPFDASPEGRATFVEHATEVVVIISIMGAGLGLDRRIGWRRWRTTWRLLAVAMPLTIVAVALLGYWALGAVPAVAALLGAVLAPTDPVLAGEVQVGEPASEPVESDLPEDEVRFGLTSEAGLNDALAFPFVYFAITMSLQGTAVQDWVLEWFAVDVVYRLAVGLLGGLAVGWLLGRLFFSSRRRELRLSEHREGFVALAATFLAYGATELVQGYGFVAVFVAAVTIRSSERFHDYHRELHHFVEQVERLLTVLVLLALGMAAAEGLFDAVGWREAVFAAGVLLVVRPVTGYVALLGSGGLRRERAAIAFFGVRGIGSLYYLAYALTHGDFDEQGALYGVVGLVVLGSVLLHGLTAGPVMSRLDRQRDLEPAGTAGKPAPTPKD